MAKPLRDVSRLTVLTILFLFVNMAFPLQSGGQHNGQPRPAPSPVRKSGDLKILRLVIAPGLPYVYPISFRTVVMGWESAYAGLLCVI